MSFKLFKEILIGDVLYDGATEKFKDKPQCGAAGARTLILKPGHYSFRASKTGNDHEGRLIMVKLLQYSHFDEKQT